MCGRIDMQTHAGSALDNYPVTLNFGLFIYCMATAC